ncbi:hypothetical protein [Candidatus Pelagisphaera phototrophica]|uniref:hypothetical protein n=1 Tax=Candidatus Pelagisphaera phototrophica TaxID=2684113 RepID=UPI001A0F88D8|nr:hypothetical protein [Candidatus Pelagisphaera phototrophica]QXD33045.1 hypothetical protein GA004_04860 [Candidatus Pelagisphaera phototrophica]
MDASEFKVSESLAATGGSKELTDREKHLIGLAVVLTRGCEHKRGIAKSRGGLCRDSGSILE